MYFRTKPIEKNKKALCLLMWNTLQDTVLCWEKNTHTEKAGHRRVWGANTCVEILMRYYTGIKNNKKYLGELISKRCP